MVLLTTFFIVFAWNVIPLFAPPTWMVLSFVAFTYHPHPLIVLAILGAVAATAGRVALAKLSFVIVRQKFLGEKTKKNIDQVKAHLLEHRALTFGLFLFYAFSPLPSNQLFIAYGLTGMPIGLVALPFFLGRCVSYSFWVFTASEISHHLAAQKFQNRSYIGGYFIAAQLFTVFVVWLFAKIDWKILFTEKKIRLLK